MTDTLPPLPKPCNKGSTGFGQLWNPLYTADQLCAYGAACAAAVEAERDAAIAEADRERAERVKAQGEAKALSQELAVWGDELPKAQAQCAELRQEIASVLDDWNALVAAIGSPTNGGAVGFARELRAERDALRAEVERLRSGEQVAPAHIRSR